MNFEEITKQCEELEQLRNVTHLKEKDIINALNEKEKELFNGKTCIEYMSTIDDTIELEHMTIRRKGYDIYGTYKVEDNVSLKINSTVFVGSYYGSGKTVYSTMTLPGIHKKYIQQREILITEMGKYKIENPCDEIRDKYSIHSQ